VDRGAARHFQRGNGLFSEGKQPFSLLNCRGNYLVWVSDGAVQVPGAGSFPPLEAIPMAKKKAKKKSKRKPNAAFMKPVMPDAKLAAVVGAKGLPRTELTKKLWAYIKRNGLQDKKNRRNINADAKLLAVFNGKKTVSMFEMTKLVNRHVK